MNILNVSIPSDVTHPEGYQKPLTTLLLLETHIQLSTILFPDTQDYHTQLPRPGPHYKESTTDVLGILNDYLTSGWSLDERSVEREVRTVYFEIGGRGRSHSRGSRSRVRRIGLNNMNS